MCFIKYLHLVDNHPTRISKVDRMFKEHSQNWKRKYISIKVFGYEKREKFLLYLPKNTFKKHVNLLFLEEKDKTIMSLLKILILSCTIILYIVEDSIFAGKNVILLTALKLMLNKELKFLRNVNMLDSKLWKEKSYHLWFMQILKVF